MGKNQENDILKNKILIEFSENSGDSLTIIDPKGEIIYANKKTVEIFGGKKKELIGKKYDNLGIKNATEIFQEIINGERKEIEIQIKNKDNKKIYLEIRASLIELTKKTYITIIAKDITKEKELNISNVKCKTILKSGPDPIFVINKDGIFEETNDAFVEKTGYKKDEIIGKSLFEPVPFLIGEDKKKAIENFQKRINGKEIKPYNLKINTKNNEIIHAEINASVVRYNKKIHGEVVVARDITERKKAQKIIENELNRLKSISKIRSTIISNISHELRTPLIAQRGYVQFLLEKEPFNLRAEQIKYLENILEGINREKKLIDELLETEKLESMKVVSTKELIKPSQIIDKVLFELYYYIWNYKHTIETYLEENIYLLADKKKIHQLFTDLIINAIKYTDKKGTITIKTKKEGNNFVFIVKDTGIGFSKDDKEELFKKYGTIEGTTIKGGFGLGLYRSKQIVELHGGSIDAHSPGKSKGATFIVKIPLNT